jgi:hypothetical protein
MTEILKLMQIGTPSELAKEIAKLTTETGITLTGKSVQSQAYEGLGDICVVTAATSATGDVFKLRDPTSARGFEKTQFVVNRAAAQVRVFCPTDGILNGTTNGSVTLTSGTHGLFACINELTKEYVKI